MKNTTQLLAALAAPLLLSATGQAASIVSSVTVSNGTSTSILSTSSSDPIYTSGDSAILQDLTSNGVTYTVLAGATSWVGDAEGILYPIGGTAPTVSVALGDLDLSTGTLDPLGTGVDPSTEYHDFTGQTITSSTVFFLFNNGTNSGPVVLVDNTGATISDTVSLPAEAELNDFSFSRTNGGDLNNREVAGATFSVSEFTFTGGNTVANVAGFRGSGGTFDAQDAGIAAIPEPSVALLGGLGLLGLLRRRRGA